MIITIDGPAGAGKSTVAKKLAKRLGWRFLDTGAMYRAVTWKARQLKLTDLTRIATMIRDTELSVSESQVVCDGVDITAAIRDPEIATALKPIADSPECRAELVKMQRKVGEAGRLVTEGRDQGSVVFPDAAFKFYLDASIDERARRRHSQEGGNLSDIKEAIKIRDNADMSRPVGRLVKPDGAEAINTTNMSVDQVVERILTVVFDWTQI